MKRIALFVVMVLMCIGASARSIHYFTYSQAARTVNYLNTQNELMIYCGYDYEIETYVLINEIWMERVNSSYYEVWIYGFDAYTGDEIYMPLDLHCVWLYSAGRMYNAAQYLRFRVEVRVPSIAWRIPPYNPYTRLSHRPGYARTYHYDIHRHGWMPPAYTYGPGVPPPPLPYYYMRRPNTPAPMPSGRWTPGSNRPEVPTPAQPHHIGNTTSASNPSAGSSHAGSSSRNMTNEPASNTNTSPTNSSSRSNNTGTSASSSRSNNSSAASSSRSSNSSASSSSSRSSNNSASSSSSRSGSSSRASSTTTTSRSSSAAPSTTPSRSRTTTTTSPSRPSESATSQTDDNKSKSRAAASSTSTRSSSSSRNSSSRNSSSRNSSKTR